MKKLTDTYFTEAGLDAKAGVCTIVDDRLLARMLSFINVHGTHDSDWAYINAYLENGSPLYAEYCRHEVNHGNENYLSFEDWQTAGMKPYEVRARMSTLLHKTVWARDESSAITIAQSVDGSEFNEVPNSGVWELLSAVPTKG